MIFHANRVHILSRHLERMGSGRIMLNYDRQLFLNLKINMFKRLMDVHHFLPYQFVAGEMKIEIRDENIAKRKNTFEFSLKMLIRYRYLLETLKY